MPGVHTATEVLDDGTPVAVTMTVADGRATIAIDAPASATSMRPAPWPEPGCCMLRCLIDEPLPLLNEVAAPRSNRDHPAACSTRSTQPPLQGAR